MDIQFIKVFFAILTILCIILNATSLVILYRTKNLKQCKFKCLVLYLSISDTLIGVLILANIIRGLIQSNDLTTMYICSIFGNFIIATTTFSMFQVLLICLERLNASYPTQNIILQRLTSNRGVCVGFAIIQVYSLGFWLFDVLTDQPRCYLVSSIIYLVAFDIPAFALTTATIVLYCIIIVRIIRQHKKIETHLTEQSGHLGSVKWRNMRRNIITLGIIVTISTLITIPRPIASIVSLTMMNQPTYLLSLNISTYLMILNPLIDPIIYVLRIKTFRDCLRCNRCKSSDIEQITSFQVRRGHCDMVPGTEANIISTV